MEVMVDKKIRVIDTVFNPVHTDNTNVFYYKGEDKRSRYKVWIFLDGRETYYVDHVKYRLHSTFSEPLKKVKRTINNPNCSLVIWTWGTFELGVEIVFKSGETVVTSHQMSYDKQLLKQNLTFIDSGAI